MFICRGSLTENFFCYILVNDQYFGVSLQSMIIRLIVFFGNIRNFIRKNYYFEQLCLDNQSFLKKKKEKKTYF